jgi:hypothetical protein
MHKTRWVLAPLVALACSEPEAQLTCTTDADGDGFYDAEDTVCEAQLETYELDCDDADEDVNPAADELVCNGVDDDCAIGTTDTPDADYDGVGVCEGDCDDEDANRAPDQVDLCHDGVDNNCNDVVDDDCPPLYSGVWNVEEPVTYKCILGAINVNFDRLLVADDNPSIVMTSEADLPGEMKGALTNDADVVVERWLNGDCDETYTLTGSFVDADHFEGTFTTEYEGTCVNCESGSFDVVMNRE